MATIMNSDKETAEFEALPEYVREAKPRARETYEFLSPKYQSEAPRYQPEQSRNQYEPEISSYAPEDAPPVRAQKHDVLETLWPGVHHDFGHGPAKRSPSFYLTLGFMGGAIISLAGVYLYGVASPMVVGAGKSAPAAVVASKEAATATASTAGPHTNGDTIIPSSPTYEVQTGDTLAGIAFKNYKHCSPRLLDEICKANNLKNANVLTLGQKINLPQYQPQSATSQIAATTNSVAQ
jgi:LysM repeat protein